jgi:hypothetical protein
MEYEKLYLKTFDEVHSFTENYIKNKLIEYINIDYGFNKASNEILVESEKKFETNKFNTNNPYTDLIYIFNNERKKYSKNIYENVLKRDVKPVFDNLEINDYTFEDLIKDLAEYYSETNTYRIFRNHYTLFDIIYKSEDFSEFEIKEYDSDQEYSRILTKYKNLAFSDSKENTENIKINSQDNISNDIENNDSINNKTKSSEEDKTKILFTSEENCLLIYLLKSIMLEGGFETDAELYKVLSLIHVKKLSEFGNKNSYRSTHEYRALSGKFNVINIVNIDKNPKYKLQDFYYLLDGLSSKLKVQNLKNIYEKSEKIKSMIETQIS